MRQSLFPEWQDIRGDQRTAVVTVPLNISRNLQRCQCEEICNIGAARGNPGSANRHLVLARVRHALSPQFFLVGQAITGLPLLARRPAFYERNGDIVLIDWLPGWSLKQQVGQGRIFRHEHTLCWMLLKKLLPARRQVHHLQVRL